jgi:hypothetical protein
MIVSPGSLEAQQPTAPPCSYLADLARMLRSQYREHAVAVGQQDDGHLLRIFASDAGTWSAVSIAEDGWSCIVAAGKRWKLLRPGDGSPAAAIVPSPREGVARNASAPKPLEAPTP